MAKQLNIFSRKRLINEINESIKEMAKKQGLIMNQVSEDAPAGLVLKLYPLFNKTEIVYEGTFTDTFNKVRPADTKSTAEIFKLYKKYSIEYNSLSQNNKIYSEEKEINTVTY